ncbi:MarR family winged helix-turn-helix transcriptional regulator [Streptacidiphilus albus]|uniref:MarR family winged helix-turn-helix transcriptional regulator n=1 Tax=Streptacidiphilus albus TaxID=105425 RepID=UPI0005A6C03B|nr:MarR family winged helix-turn-helix transcriptional regulator [Streptacidiphilus albus]
MTAKPKRQFTDEEAEALLGSVGPAFTRLRRSVLLDVEKPVSAKDLSRTPVLTVVEAGAAEEPPREVNIGAITENLSVDPSVASRMVSDCIQAGYLTRQASQTDGRRTVLRLTPEGEAMLANFRRQQRDAYVYITRDWNVDDRLAFAQLLLKYVDAVNEVRRDAAPARAKSRDR